MHTHTLLHGVYNGEKTNNYVQYIICSVITVASFGGGQGVHLPLSDFKRVPKGRCPVVAVLPILYFIRAKTWLFYSIFRKYYTMY